MQKLNNDSDIKKYLQSGNLTKPFLESEYVLEKVMCDYNFKREQGKDITKLESLAGWINHIAKFSNDREFKDKYRFQRTAEEIWKSKIFTGCTDCAIVFATFARQIGIPTTILATAEKSWLESFLKGEETSHRGHSFCECFYEGEWFLVDPTSRRIERKYDTKKLVLSYNVGVGNVYYPYLRCLDFEVRQDTKTHNRKMDNYCKNIKI